MKSQDVKRKEIEIINKKGVRDSKGKIIVPIEYDFVEQVNDNLFVATKGSINGLRYQHGSIVCSVEQGGTYGIIFDKKINKKILDTEVDFYTREGKISSDRKIKAAFVCQNDGMFLIIDENYKWSFAFVDYSKRVLATRTCTDVDNIKMDYRSNRFIVNLNGKEYVVISFNNDNTICEYTKCCDYEPVEVFDAGISIKKDDKYGFMAYNGEILLECKFDYLSPQRVCIVTERNGKEEIYTCTGHFIASQDNYVRYQVYTHEDIEFILFKGKNLKYCLYSSKKQLLSCEYSSIDLHDKYAIVSQDGKYALLHYDKELDEMLAVHPIDYPETSCKKMKFVYDRKKTSVEVDGILKKKKYIINLE